MEEVIKAAGVIGCFGDSPEGRQDHIDLEKVITAYNEAKKRRKSVDE
jgi:hypothetical protein